MIVFDDRPATSSPPATTVEEPRVDALAKATGTAGYVDDLPDLPGMVYGVCLRSPYAHARVGSIDSSAAEALPGVLGVLHGGNVEGLGLHLDEASTDQDFIARGKARYPGDLMGMIAALDRR